MKRFLKGVFELRPPTPRYDVIWDANVVLDFLSFQYPNEDIPLPFLTCKLVMLLALSTAQRAQTLQKIYVKNIVFSENLVYIPIIELIKQSKCNNRKFALHLKPYVKNRAICVVDTLKEYLKRTKILRGNQDQLLISFIKPHKAVSRDTISRWLKLVLEQAGIDVDVFKGHSTRAASCGQVADCQS